MRKCWSYLKRLNIVLWVVLWVLTSFKDLCAFLFHHKYCLPWSNLGFKPIYVGLLYFVCNFFWVVSLLRYWKCKISARPCGTVWYGSKRIGVYVVRVDSALHFSRCYLLSVCMQIRCKTLKAKPYKRYFGMYKVNDSRAFTKVIYKCFILQWSA